MSYVSTNITEWLVDIKSRKHAFMSGLLIDEVLHFSNIKLKASGFILWVMLLAKLCDNELLAYIQVSTVYTCKRKQHAEEIYVIMFIVYLQTSTGGLSTSNGGSSSSSKNVRCILSILCSVTPLVTSTLQQRVNNSVCSHSHTGACSDVQWSLIRSYHP